MDIWERIRFARDGALKAEETERQRLAEADTSELQRAASVRLATRQAVREALDDVLDEHSEPAKGKSTAAESADEPATASDSADEPVAGSDPNDEPATASDSADSAADASSEGGAPAVDDVKEEIGEDTDPQVSG